MATPEGYTELRVNIPNKLAMDLDAVIVSRFGPDGHRGQFVTPELELLVAREISKATVLLRMCRINPLDSDRSRNE